MDFSGRRWLTPKECADYLSIHLKTVYAQIAKGGIPAVKIGGSVRVDLEALNEKFERQEANAEAKNLKEWS